MINQSRFTRSFTSTSRFGLIAAAAVLPLFSQAKPPVVNPDQSVTFSLLAPYANKVYVGGEFDDRYNRPPGAEMTRDEKGVWTYTSRPLEPGIYYYGFVVDELFTIDPGNPRYRPEIKATPINNVLEIRGAERFPWEIAPGTPRGTVHVETMQSTHFNRTVQMYVYTPPSYGRGSETYPILYLLHGSPGTGREWTLHGYADQILDNLIAAGKAKEMIVVMPDAQVPLPSTTAEQQAANLQLFERYLIEEVMPFAEGRYRVQAAQPTRWLAGLSRGGLQTFHVGFRRPDLFSALGPFSIGLPSGYPDAYPALADAAKFNGQVPVIFYSCGKDDSNQLAGYQRGLAELSSRGVRFDTATAPGGHIWEIWRNSFAEFVTRLR